MHAEHVRRALRLTPSGGEPVTGNDLLGGGAEARPLSARSQIQKWRRRG
jgi:hypothetical protein